MIAAAIRSKQRIEGSFFSGSNPFVSGGSISRREEGQVRRCPASSVVRCELKRGEEA